MENVIYFTGDDDFDFSIQNDHQQNDSSDFEDPVEKLLAAGTPGTGEVSEDGPFEQLHESDGFDVFGLANLFDEDNEHQNVQATEAINNNCEPIDPSALSVANGSAKSDVDFPNSNQNEHQQNYSNDSTDSPNSPDASFLKRIRPYLTVGKMGSQRQPHQNFQVIAESGAISNNFEPIESSTSSTGNYGKYFVQI